MILLWKKCWAVLTSVAVLANGAAAYAETNMRYGSIERVDEISRENLIRLSGLFDDGRFKFKTLFICNLSKKDIFLEIYAFISKGGEEASFFWDLVVPQGYVTPVRLRIDQGQPILFKVSQGSYTNFISVFDNLQFRRYFIAPEKSILDAPVVKVLKRLSGANKVLIEVNLKTGHDIIRIIVRGTLLKLFLDQCTSEISK